MKKLSLTLLFVAASTVGGCGARTSDDDLLGSYGPNPNGGGDGDGDGAGGRPTGDGGTGGFIGSGGFATSGGFVGSGGFVASGGVPAVGGSNPSGGFGGGPAGNCCRTSTNPGCEEPTVEECVCAFDGFCCAQAWDQACVDEADRFCSAGCSMGVGGSPGAGGSPSTGGFMNTGGFVNTGGTPGVGGTPGGDCCEIHDGTGCQVPNVQSCVCGMDPFCCSNYWDQICVNEAINDCSANCMMGTGGATSTGGAPNTGGSPGTGGVIDQCEQVFNDDCGQCLCNGCFDELETCLGDFGCLAILACLDQTGCSGFGCYQPDTCQGVIDTFGGVLGTSTQNAFSLGSCAALSGCPCN